MEVLFQFFKLAKPFWFNRKHWLDWLLLILIISLALAIINVSVWLAEWNKAFFDALAVFNAEIMPNLIATYIGYIALVVLFIVSSSWLNKVLVFRWRAHLTEQFQYNWLQSHTHYQLQFNTQIDNPDQRIAEDIYLLADKTIYLFKSFVMNVAKLGAFIVILWSMSGVQVFQFGHQSITIHGYLVWVALIYSVVCTWVMHLIGRKLKYLNIDRQHREADYRATLLRIRDNSEQIALYCGEERERARLMDRFDYIKQNWWELIKRELKVDIFSSVYVRISMFIPLFATLPMYLARTMTMGDMMQTRSAFGNVQDGFGWFMDYYENLIEWSAIVKRLADFDQALKRVELGQEIRSAEEPSIDIYDLTVRTPEGQVLFTNFNANLTACHWVLLEGNSGVGKSTLLKVLAGLWQNYEGRFNVKAGSFLFLPQKPYLSEDSLRATLSYPSQTLFDDQLLKAALVQVGLSHLTDKLSETSEWNKWLSGGEQQRLSLARALLQRPQLLLLDEATSHLDDESALGLMQVLRQSLPSSLCITVSHQSAVQQLFERKLVL